MSFPILSDMNLSPAWVDWFNKQGWLAVHWSLLRNAREPGFERNTASPALDTKLTHCARNSRAQPNPTQRSPPKTLTKPRQSVIATDTAMAAELGFGRRLKSSAAWPDHEEAFDTSGSGSPARRLRTKPARNSANRPIFLPALASSRAAM